MGALRKGVILHSEGLGLAQDTKGSVWLCWKAAHEAGFGNLSEPLPRPLGAPTALHVTCREIHKQLGQPV